MHQRASGIKKKLRTHGSSREKDEYLTHAALKDTLVLMHLPLSVNHFQAITPRFRLQKDSLGTLFSAEIYTVPYPFLSQE